MLAPNSPLRAAVTALATPAQTATVQGAPTSTGECAPSTVPLGSALPTQGEPVSSKRPAHYLRALLIARIYAVLPHILNHIGVELGPPHIAPARGPPLWDDCGAQVGEDADGEPDWDIAAQPAPDDEVDQSVNW